MLKDLSRETIKYIAAAAMLLDHIAVIFLTEGTPVYTLFRMAGGFTAVTMCCFLAEGFCRTHDLKRYRQRLLLFALAAQIPYQLAFSRAPLTPAPLNMLFNLYFSLCFLEAVTRTGTLQGWAVLFPVLSCLCDWSILAPVYVLLFFRYPRGRAFPAWAAAIGLNAVMCTVTALAGAQSPWWGAYLSLAGQMAACALICAGYRGRQLEKHRDLHKWFFYLWYPLQLTVFWEREKTL